MKFEDRLLNYIEKAENIVLILISLVLLFLAATLLIGSISSIFSGIITGTLSIKSIEILNGVLLVMMVMEILYTVHLSVKSHTLKAEPFLIIGIIAAVRQILVITAESSHLDRSTPDFRNFLLEIGVLGLLILCSTVSVYLMGRNEKKQMNS